MYGARGGPTTIYCGQLVEARGSNLPKFCDAARLWVVSSRFGCETKPISKRKSEMPSCRTKPICQNLFHLNGSEPNVGEDNRRESGIAAAETGSYSGQGGYFGGRRRDDGGGQRECVTTRRRRTAVSNRDARAAWESAIPATSIHAISPAGGIETKKSRIV